MSTQQTALRWIYQGYVTEPALAALDHSQLVLGEGPAIPAVVIVGEAPGRSEAEQGRPFVGRAGRALDGYLLDAGLPRESCYVTNVVKLRPVTESGRDRTPTDAEELASLPYLWRELHVATGDQCKVICALGRTAASALTGQSVSVSRVRGTWRVITDPAGIRYALFITYHPAAALRNSAMGRALAADLITLADSVGRLGSMAASVLA